MRDKKFKIGYQVLILLPTDKKKHLMQWKGPFEIRKIIGINDYGVKVGPKIKTFYANMLKEYVERQRDQDTKRVERRGDEAISASVLHLAGPAVIERNESGPEEAVDDNDLLEIGSTRQRETATDVTFGQQLNAEQRAQLQQLIKRYEHIFTDIPGNSNLIEHEVELISDEPIRSKPYVIPYSVRESLKKDIRAMLDMGVIRESKSPYGSPVVIVRKKDGTNRICVDFRKLNRVTVFDPTPITPAEDIFQKMAKKKYLTKLDLSKGYWQIPVAGKDIPKTAFVTPDGTYEFVKMPFGRVNSGATLVRGLRKLLSDLEDVDSFIDDIIVNTETWEGHLTAVEELFRRLSEAGLTARPTKCIIGTKTIDVVWSQDI